MAEDSIRVLRVIEYVGPRSKVEDLIKRSVHGTKQFNDQVEIRAATIGIVADILEMGKIETLFPPI